MTIKTNQNDHGVSLVELMIAMLITSILSGMVLGTILTMSKVTAKLTEQTQDNIEVKRTLDLISTNLRGATVDPARPNQAQLVIAHPGEVKFMTYGGRGFNEPPRWIHYRAKQGKIYLVDPATKKEHVVTNYSVNGQIFRFYKWDMDAPTGKNGNCFVSLTPNELRTDQGRKSIVAVQIQIERLTSTNHNNRKKHAGSWVRLNEQISTDHPMIADRGEQWKNTCWETQLGRVASTGDTP